MIHENEMISRINLNDWDEELINWVLQSNNDDIFILALKTQSCPVDLILDLWQAENLEVRKLICLHSNTPKYVIKKIYEKEENIYIKEYAKKILKEK